MGMYDTISVKDETSPFLCLNGHGLYDLQTKDLDCDLDTYHLFENRLYLESGPRVRVTEDCKINELGRLCLISTRTFQRSLITMSISLIAGCDRCEPVLSLKESYYSGGDMVNEAKFYYDFEAIFRDGELFKVTTINHQSREDKIKELRGYGTQILPDTDVIAQKHLKKWRERLAEEDENP